MATHFNFTGLHSVFREAILNKEPTVAFPLANGRGRFLFLIFIPTDTQGKIKWGALELFIILSRTQAILSFDLMGQHYHQGDFKIRLLDVDVTAIRAELGIEAATNATHAFELDRFLLEVNAAIPLTLLLEEKIRGLQAERNLVQAHCGRFVEDAMKVYLIGPRSLTLPRKPREETLRKLYTLRAEARTIARLVKNLKALNWTVSWTDREPADSGAIFEKMWLKTVAGLQQATVR